MSEGARSDVGRAMAYKRYLRLEGWCSIVLGLEMAVVAFPGLIVSYESPWLGLLFVPGVLVLLAAWARWRHGVGFGRPGEWLTTRPLRRAEPGRAGLPARPLARRLLIETAVWIVGVTALVVFAGSSGLLVFGTGLASVAFGAVQAFAASRHVGSVEQARGERYLVARRPGLGTPELAVVSGRSR